MCECAVCLFLLNSVKMSQIQWHGEIPFTHTTAILTPASLPPNPHSLSHHANTLFKRVLETISHSRRASKTGM